LVVAHRRGGTPPGGGRFRHIGRAARAWLEHGPAQASLGLCDGVVAAHEGRNGSRSPSGLRISRDWGSDFT